MLRAELAGGGVTGSRLREIDGQLWFTQTFAPCITRKVIGS